MFIEIFGLDRVLKPKLVEELPDLNLAISTCNPAMLRCEMWREGRECGLLNAQRLVSEKPAVT